MMSGAAIEALSREAAVQAAAYEVEPYIPASPDEPKRWGSRVEIPNLGSYVPDGWKHVKEYCVGDWGMPGSMTSDEFKAMLSYALENAEIVGKTLGVAITATGEWCVWISIFEQDSEAKGNGAEFPSVHCPGDDCGVPLEVDESQDFKDDTCPSCGYDLHPAPFNDGDQVEGYDWNGDPIKGKVIQVDKNDESVLIDKGDEQESLTEWAYWRDIKFSYTPDNDPNQLKLGI